MIPVMSEDRETFIKMAIQHFKELNPKFVPFPDWKTHYFESIQTNRNMYLRWIMMDQERVGFIIFGVENHRFLPREIGMVYELYIVPAYRRKGIGKAVAERAIEELQTVKVSKIQLEVMVGNAKAAALWEKLGFRKVAERFVLHNRS